jgi:hypothetical protein
MNRPRAPLRVWRKDIIDGTETHRADIVRGGERLSMVVSSVPAEVGLCGLVWTARVGDWTWTSLGIALGGSLLTVEPTAELARKSAQGWAGSV